MAAELKHSSVLFTADDGSPMVFLLRPCTQKKILRPLIEHGGGVLSSIGDKNAIRLATNDCTLSSGDYISVRYIQDCVKRNKLLDMESYRMSSKRRHDLSGDIGDEDDLSHAPVIIKTVAKERKGRKKFSLEDDRHIIKFLMDERRYSEMKGNAVWKDMEILKITNHSYQSMKDRFKKQILPNIHSYPIPKSWMSALTGITSEARISPVLSTSRYSPLFRTPDSKASRSSSRGHLDSPRQSTPKKKLTDYQERSNQSESEASEVTEQMNESDTGQAEDHGQSEKRDRNSDSKKRDKNTQSDKRSQKKQSPRKMVEEPDRSSDEFDEFDRELYRMSVVDKDTDKGKEQNVNGNQSVADKSPVRPSARQHRKARGDQPSPEKEVSSTSVCEESSLQKSRHRPRRVKSTSDSSPEKGSPVKQPVRRSERQLRLGESSQKDTCTESELSSDSKRHRSGLNSPARSGKRKVDDLVTDLSESSPEKRPAGGKQGEINHGQPRIKERKAKENKAAQNGVSGTDRVKTPAHRALTDFVMSNEQPGSSQESQDSGEEDMETDLENSAEPDEVKKHCQIVKRLCSRFDLTPGDVLQALWANSGSLRNTVHYLLYGVDTSGHPAWTEEDDQLLESSKSEEINLLRRRYGAARVDQRAAFLEDSSLK